jgi:hypothetical protein
MKQYSDLLLIVLLKARDPERFCERVRAAKYLHRLKDEAAAGNRADPLASSAARTAIEALERIAADKVAPSKVAD